MPQSTFCGYEQLQGEGKVLAILKGGAEVDAAAAGDDVQIVLDRTPFYAESGGQVGDVGTLTSGAAPLPRHRHEEARRCAPARRQGRGRRLPQGRRRHGAGGCRDAPGDGAQPFRDAPPARGAAQGPRHARDPERLAGRARSPALRFLAHAGGHPAGARDDRAHGERGNPRATRAGHIRQHALRRRDQVGRDGAVRREVRRRGARAVVRRLLDRALRRHARRPHRRHRPVQDHGRGRHRLRHPPHRGGDGRGRARGRARGRGDAEARGRVACARRRPSSRAR